ARYQHESSEGARPHDPAVAVAARGRGHSVTTRRQLLIALAVGALATPFASRAQQQRVYRIGFLGNSTAPLEANLVGPFREGLRDLGYVEGRNVLIEYRWAEGKV